ncbi:MAG: SMC-Scp complex subunit ScpB [Caldilineaceae bacterium]
MSKPTLAHIVNPESNGNGVKPNAISSSHTNASPHGGVADGLPVALPSRIDDGGQAHTNGGKSSSPAGNINGNSHGNGTADEIDDESPIGRGNGHGNRATHIAEMRTANGNGRSAPKLPFDPEPDIELSHPGSGAMAPLTAVLESLLFVAGEAMDVSYLAKALQLKTEQVRDGLARLAQQYKARGGGLRLQMHNDRYQLVTAPATAPFVEDFLNIDISTKLSSAALETLAIVAYRQPVTRVQIEGIRGVDCSGVLRSLVARGLVEEAGRLDAVGRPIVYGVTEQFMQQFGLTELSDLPPLGHEDADMLYAASALAEETPDDKPTRNSVAAPSNERADPTHGDATGVAVPSSSDVA